MEHVFKLIFNLSDCIKFTNYVETLFSLTWKYNNRNERPEIVENRMKSCYAQSYKLTADIQN